MNEHLAAHCTHPCVTAKTRAFFHTPSTFPRTALHRERSHEEHTARYIHFYRPLIVVRARLAGVTCSPFSCAPDKSAPTGAGVPAHRLGTSPRTVAFCRLAIVRRPSLRRPLGVAFASLAARGRARARLLARFRRRTHAATASRGALSRCARVARRARSARAR
jgi:hypothetical protein